LTGVVTISRCGGRNHNNLKQANFPRILLAKNFENGLMIDKVNGKTVMLQF